MDPSATLYDIAVAMVELRCSDLAAAEQPEVFGGTAMRGFGFVPETPTNVAASIAGTLT